MLVDVHNHYLPLKNTIGLFDYSSLGFLCGKNVMGISEISIKIDGKFTDMIINQLPMKIR